MSVTICHQNRFTYAFALSFLSQLSFVISQPSNCQLISSFYFVPYLLSIIDCIASARLYSTIYSSSLFTHVTPLFVTRDFAISRRFHYSLVSSSFIYRIQISHSWCLSAYPHTALSSPAFQLSQRTSSSLNFSPLSTSSSNRC